MKFILISTLLVAAAVQAVPSTLTRRATAYAKLSDIPQGVTTTGFGTIQNSGGKWRIEAADSQEHLLLESDTNGCRYTYNKNVVAQTASTCPASLILEFANTALIPDYECTKPWKICLGGEPDSHQPNNTNLLSPTAPDGSSAMAGGAGSLRTSALSGMAAAAGVAYAFYA